MKIILLVTQSAAVTKLECTFKQTPENTIPIIGYIVSVK